MKISFSTLGCPEWDLDTICSRGNHFGYQGIDFRGYLNTLDITLSQEFTADIVATRQKIFDASLEVSAISSSIAICLPEAFQRNVEEARRTIPLAQALGTKNIRVFGGGDLKGFSRDELISTGKECMDTILQIDGAKNLKWLVETHDLWIQSSQFKGLLDRIPDPAFGALWDIGLTPWMAGEDPEDTFAAIGERVGYTHLKDSVYEPGHPQAGEDGWHYVLPGTGQIPLLKAIRILKQNRYQGWLTFEHEKRWHPDLPEPDIAFPAFVQWIKPILG